MGVMGEGNGAGTHGVLGKNPGATAFRCDATGSGGVGTETNGGQGGLRAWSLHGKAAWGNTSDGTGVRAESATSRALEIVGKMYALGAGLAHFDVGQRVKTFTLPAGTVAASGAIILASIQTDLGATPTIGVAFSRRVADNQIQIGLTANAPMGLDVGFHIVHPTGGGVLTEPEARRIRGRQ